MRSFFSQPIIPNLIPDSEAKHIAPLTPLLNTDINTISLKDEYVKPRSSTTDTTDSFYFHPPNPDIPPMKPFVNPFDALTTVLNEAEDCIYDVDEEGPSDSESWVNSRSSTTAASSERHHLGL